MKKLIYAVSIATMVLSSCSQETPQTGGSSYPTLPLQTEDVTLMNSYSATIRGRQDIAILPQVSGFLTELKVVEGQRVKKGQPLFQIDSVNFAAALRVAEANSKAAEALVATNELTYKSKQTLRAKDVISDYELQLAENALLTAKAQLAQAQAGVVNARQNLSYTVVKAPCDGVVGTLPYRVGTLVSPQMPTPLTTVSDNSVMYVYFSLTEVQAMNIVRRYGSLENAIHELPDISLQLSDGTTYAHLGRVETISGVLDNQTGAISVRASFPNPEHALFSGGSGNVLIPTLREGVLIISQEATYEIQNKTYCYRVIDGKAVSTIVRVTALPDGKRYIVEDGLQAGDVIVAQGAAFIREGEEL